MQTFAQDLKAQIAANRLGLKQGDLTNPTVMAQNLNWLYHLMVASENLLCVAANCSYGHGDPLHLYFLEHLQEERGHAEWLRADMQSADIQVGGIPREIMLAVGVQYYLVYHVNPAALLGYMLALEAFPTPMAQIELLEAVHGKKLLRTIRHHAEHDIAHSGALMAVIDSRPTHERPAIQEAATQAMHFIIMALHSSEHQNG